MENKTKIIIAVSIIGVVTLLIIGVILFKIVGTNNLPKTQIKTQVQQENQTPTIDPQTQAQLDELNTLRNQQGTTTAQPSTSEETQKQLNDLDALRKQTNAKKTPPTQAEVNDQLSQLDALRKASK